MPPWALPLILLTIAWSPVIVMAFINRRSLAHGRVYDAAFYIGMLSMLIAAALV